MNKEAKELLKDAIKEHNDDCLLCAVKDTRINSALTLLEQPECKTCKDTGKRTCASCSGDGKVGIPPDIICPMCKGAGVIPCPDCQLVAEDFTKNIRDALEVMDKDGKFHRKIMEKACGIINRAEAELKAKDKLLFAYESVNAPVDPLIAINKELLAKIKRLESRVEYWQVADKTGTDIIDKAKTKT